MTSDFRETIDRLISVDKFSIMTQIAIEISLEDIFENEISIKTTKAADLGSVIGVDIPLNGRIYSLIGKVVDIKSAGLYYYITIESNLIPEAMYADIEMVINRASF